jgi:hypothetical protein
MEDKIEDALATAANKQNTDARVTLQIEYWKLNIED